MDAYRQLRQDCEDNRIDTLWCYDTDRLGRDPALAQQVASLCQKNGVSVYVQSGNYTLEPGSSPQRFMFAFQSTQAGVEQEKRVHRHRFGMRGRIEDGLHANHWPYGYRPVRSEGEVVGGEFVPSEIGAVRQMTEWFLDGHGYSAIARRLNESDWQPPKADHWWPASVRCILQNDTYAGYVTFGDARAKSDKFPALWDEDTHRLLKQERANRSVGGRKPASPVSGIAYCERCGYALAIRARYADGDARFACLSHARRYTGAYEPCHPNSVKESVLTGFVDALLSRLAVVDALMGKRDSTDLERQVLEAEAEVERLRERHKRLALRVAEGVVAVDAARDADRELQARLDAARATRDAALETLSLRPDPDEVRAELSELAGTSVRDLPTLQVRAALKRAKLRVYVEEGEIVRATIG